MDRNVSGLDRTARLTGGTVLALVGLAVFLDVIALGQLVGTALLVAGLVFIVTGAIQWCPLSRVLGIDTCSRG